MARVFRGLTLRGAVDAEVRTASFEGREHVVVPVVALVGDQVIVAANASGPELVPASVIERSHSEWNGRPVVGDHPMDASGEPVSANDPGTCERACFGRIANPSFRNNRLVVEAWLDADKAKAVGPDAEGVLERALVGEPIEVSIGAWVRTNNTPGQIDSNEYVATWTDIGSDHLAMLPEGVLGACDNEMGCGAPRVAMRVCADGLELDEAHESDLTKDKLMAHEPVATNEDLELDEAHESEATKDENMNRTDKPSLLRRVMAGIRDLLEEDLVGAGASPCGCPDSEHCECGGRQAAQDSEQGGPEMTDLKGRIGALIQHAYSPFTEADEEYLSGLSVERIEASHSLAEGTEELSKQAERYVAADKRKEELAGAEPTGAKMHQVDEETYREMRAALDERKAIRAARKEQLIAAIQAAGTECPDKYLQDKDVEELEVIAKLAGAEAVAEPTFAARALPNGGEDLSRFQPPDPYGLSKQAEVN